MEGTRSLRDEPNYYIDDPTLNTQAGRTRYQKGTASDSEEEKNGRSPVANGQIAARSHEPSPVSTAGSFSPTIEVSFVRKLSLNDGAQNVAISDRPPVPAPFPVHSDDEEDNYIDPSSINTPPRYKILINQKSSNKRNNVQYYKCRVEDHPKRIGLKILKPPKRDEEDDEDDYEDLDMK
ncbi:uncharacterized protein LOC134774910 [Penaeus indicus]|uniref:uncharacterized protein LOC134774910 n=1 Tax=Penaeus indicus TaxID=29960 RepID=UPI00300CBCF5